MEHERAQCGVGTDADHLQQDDDMVARLDLCVDCAFEPHGSPRDEDGVGPDMSERSRREAPKPVLACDLASDVALALCKDRDTD